MGDVMAGGALGILSVFADCELLRIGYCGAVDWAALEFSAATLSPWAAAAGLLIIFVLTGFFFHLIVLRRLKRPWRQLAEALFLVGCSACLVQIGVNMALSKRLESNNKAATVYKKVFGFDTAGPAAAKFCKHPYINYVLNPAATLDGGAKVNAVYKIKRKEQIRDRNNVPWRCLVIGGSTTMGEWLSEEDSWVWQLERIFRERYGNGCDVINGGVSGYSLCENLVHYITLLTHLEPDVVILYVGINDVSPRLVGDLQPDYSNFRYPAPQLDDCDFSPVRWLSPLSCYRYWYLVRRIEPLVSVNLDDRVSIPLPDATVWEEQLHRNGPEIYERNLENLVALLCAQRRKVVIIPQYFIVDGKYSGSDATKWSAFQFGVMQHNLANERVARQFGVPFASDVVASGAFALSDTFDHCHFNRDGSSTMARRVYQYLEKNGLAPRRLLGTPSWK